MRHGHKLNNARMGNKGTRCGQNECPDQGGKRLCLTMTIGMIRIRWLGSVLESTPDQERAKEIQQRLDSIGYQGIRTSKDPSCNLPS
jgi:hypothetical protein